MILTDVIWLHIKSIHDVFSDVTVQEFLRFTQVPFLGILPFASKEKICHFIATQYEMHDVSFMLSYATY